LNNAHKQRMFWQEKGIHCSSVFKMN